MSKFLHTAGIWMQAFCALLFILMAIFDHTTGLVFWALILGCLTTCLTAFYLFVRRDHIPA